MTAGFDRMWARGPRADIDVEVRLADGDAHRADVGRGVARDGDERGDRSVLCDTGVDIGQLDRTRHAPETMPRPTSWAPRSQSVS